MTDINEINTIISYLISEKAKGNKINEGTLQHYCGLADYLESIDSEGEIY